MSTHPVTVVAFGGNAMWPSGERGSPAEQIAHAHAACHPLASRIAAGERFVLVHGNGPQVGRELDRGFAARATIDPVPLDVYVAATQGTMGYYLEIALREALRAAGAEARIATLATLVRVDEADPAFQHPDKPIGPFYSETEAARIAHERGARFVEDAGRGHRQVVPSPRPIEVLDLGAISALLDTRHVVIAGGGGGIPVVREASGALRGVEAVVDKDHTAALIATMLRARSLVDLTGVDFVYRDFGKPTQAALPRLTLDEALALHAAGQFPPGSMGPKILAACAFLQAGGGEVLISSMRGLEKALSHELGTRMVPS